MHREGLAWLSLIRWSGRPPSREAFDVASEEGQLHHRGRQHRKLVSSSVLSVARKQLEQRAGRWGAGSRSGQARAGWARAGA